MNDEAMIRKDPETTKPTVFPDMIRLCIKTKGKTNGMHEKKPAITNKASSTICEQHVLDDLSKLSFLTHNLLIRISGMAEKTIPNNTNNDHQPFGHKSHPNNIKINPEPAKKANVLYMMNFFCFNDNFKHFMHLIFLISSIN